MQSPAILIPQDTSLPIKIDCIDIFSNNGIGKKPTIGNLTASVEILAKTHKEVKALIVVTDPKGNVMGRLEGYRLRVISHHEHYPTVHDLRNPQSRDSMLIQKELDLYAKYISIYKYPALVSFIHKITIK